MLLNLNKKAWNKALEQKDYEDQKENMVEVMKNYSKLTSDYTKWIAEENKKTPKEFVVWSAGKLNPPKHLSKQIESVMNESVMECLGTMVSTVAF